MYFWIKTAAVVILGFGLIVSGGLADTKHVIDRLEITLRSGPSTENKVINMIPSGQPVEVLNNSGGWSEVRLPNGTQGWVLARFLSDEAPKSALFDRLSKKYEALISQKDTLGNSADGLSRENERLTAELMQVQTQHTQLTEMYETLKSESADFIGLKNKYQNTQKELTEIRSKADHAESEMNKLSNNQFYQGMIYGGGLLAIGFIVGLIVKSPKRRSGLL